MANYAFIDQKRTKKIYANDDNIMEYKSVRCYCKNELCDARMFIYDPEHPNKAYFKASGKPPHKGACAYELNGFKVTNYIEEKFIFPDTLFPLLKPLEKKELKKTTGGGTFIIEKTEQRPISGLKEAYYMMQSYDIHDKYNGHGIRDIIADERTYKYYQDGIAGFKIVECNFYKYVENTLTIYMNYPMYPNIKYNLILEFYDVELFKKMVLRTKGKSHNGLIVVFGEWRHDDKFSYVRINSEKQISVIKKES